MSRATIAQGGPEMNMIPDFPLKMYYIFTISRQKSKKIEVVLLLKSLPFIILYFFEDDIGL